MKRPVLIALIGYIIGIIWELYFKINIAPIIIFTIIIFIKKNNNKMIFLILIPIIISNTLIINQENKYKNLYGNITDKSVFIGIIEEKQNTGEYKDTYIIKVIKLNDDSKYKNTRLLLKTSKNLEYGDKVKIIGTYAKAEIQRNYKGFDYSEYLKTKGIYGICNEEKIEIISKNSLNKIDIISYKINIKIKENIKKLLNEKEANFLIGILLGDNKSIDKEIIEDFRNSSLYHMIAISGTHMSYIVLVLEIIVKKININKKIKKIFQIMGIIGFVLVTSRGISILRASIMAIIAKISQIFYRKNDGINSISISMLIILIINPYSINNISFQLSYGGVIGIILLNEKYEKILEKIPLREKIKKIISPILSAQTIIIPIMIMNYHTISLTFLVSNLLASLIIGGIILSSLIMIFISLISLKIAGILSIFVKLIINLLFLIAKYTGKLPLSKIYVPRPNDLIIIIYYIVIFQLIIPQKNKTVEKIYEKIKNKKIQLISVTLIILLINIYIPKKLKIYFIDVGQGDSTLISTPLGKKILIDGGGSENNSTYDIGEKVLLPYLLNRGVTKLDYIIISHFDSDHVRWII